MPDQHANPHHLKRWLILGVIAIAQLMVVLDATIVNIALPCSRSADSIGTALLTTLAAAATTSYLAANARSPALVTEAAVHGYTAAFWWAAAIFASGAVLCTALLSSRGRDLAAPAAEPALAPS